MNETRILGRARAAVYGDRNRHYGNPSDNHARTATLWEAWQQVRQPGPINRLDVMALNILQKLSRLVHDPYHMDGWADIAGFAENGAWMFEQQDETWNGDNLVIPGSRGSRGL